MIRLPLPCQATDLIWNWKVLKQPKNQGLYNNTQKNSEYYSRIGFHWEPNKIGELANGAIILGNVELADF